MNIVEVNFANLASAEEQAILDKACRDFGFFALANHGIEPELQQRFGEVMKRYFAQPEASKLAQERTEQNPFGYYNKELTKNRLDEKEIFDINLNEQTLWPEDPEFIAVTSDWYQACHEVALSLLQSIFDCLGDTPGQDCFAQHTSFLRLNYYPQYTSADTSAFGVSHHTDAGALTLLLQEQVASLQFQIDGHWHTAPALPDHLLVNLGDMLQVWSNDQYRAPLHRVLTNADAERYSAPYFLNPDYAADIRPLGDQSGNYQTINWQEFRSGRAAGDYADIGEEIQISHYRRQEP